MQVDVYDCALCVIKKADLWQMQQRYVGLSAKSENAGVSRLNSGLAPKNDADTKR